MIPILHRYIARSVILATLLVIGLVLALSYFINLLGELRDVGVGDYGVPQAALHALLEVPRNLYHFFPMLVLLGGLMGLGILAASQELVVMRISGMSVRNIFKSIAMASLVLILLGLFLGELIGPRAHYLADKHKLIAQSGGQAVATGAGVWLHEGNNFLHIDRVMPHHLEGVMRYEFDANHKLLASYYVESLDYQDGQWLLHDFVKTSFGKDHTTHEQKAETTWDLTLNPTLLNVGVVEPEEMTLSKLNFYTHHLVSNGLQATEYQYNFWKRILQPLTILIMLFLTVPFVFAAPRSVTMGWRMLMGVIVGFSFYILNSLLGQLSIVFQLPPFFAAFLPIVLLAGMGYILMLKITR